MTVCYHRAKNRVVAFFFDGTTQDGYGIAAAPTADGEDLDWGVYGGGSNIGYLMDDNFKGNACSYDREKEQILWVAPSFLPSPRKAPSLSGSWG